jgi:membrane dipeptidase
MRQNSVVLLALKVTPDSKYLRATPEKIEVIQAASENELYYEFERELRNSLSYLSSQKLPLVRGRADLERALGGEPHVVLSSEGGDFLNGDLQRLEKAYASGIRHLQLVHYVPSPYGDIQTLPPKHGGLTKYGSDVLLKCNELGILVDTAHMDMRTLDGALEVSSKPLIWSHGWVSTTDGFYRDRFGFQMRRLRINHAKKIAEKGGLIGLWSLGLSAEGRSRHPDYPISRQTEESLGSYSKALARLSQELGPDHVCIGTDFGGLGPNSVVQSYRDLRVVCDKLSEQGLGDSEIEKLAYKNYARVLGAVMAE